MSYECLHCGHDATNVIRMPGTKVSKRITEMDPTGYYYFVLCDRCRTLPKYEYAAICRVHPERLVHSHRRYDDNDSAISELF